jgi:mycothiol synthase
VPDAAPEPAPTEIDADAFAGGPAAAVRRIAEAGDAVDGVSTLNEQACLQLKHRGLRGARLWLDSDPGEDGSTPGGFALRHGERLELLDLAVHPDARGRGIGTALARAALADLGRVEAWSHADHPAAARIAARFGVARERELRIMVRPTSLPVDDPQPPDGVVIRSFRPADESALLAVNAAAFAHHPEQGHLTTEDFRERTAEDWFDPEGLLLAVPAERPEELLGFHWTKVHRDEDPPYGEVYVVAVNPKAAGRGLGTVLTAAGLRHLAGTGVDRVILYVDGDNLPATALYERLGFSVVRTEVQYRGVPQPG